MTTTERQLPWRDARAALAGLAACDLTRAGAALDAVHAHPTTPTRAQVADALRIIEWWNAR